MSAPNSVISAASISDLSYRSYDGPLETPNLRWWVIARQMMLLAYRKRSYWVLTALSGWYFVVMLITLFILQQIADSTGSTVALDQFLGRLVWKDQFLHGFSYAQLLLMIIALIIGAGSIANDNRSNALLVYLSKPCSKLDYMLGKWVGLFIPMLTAIALPSIVFYAYGALSFRNHGFISDDPWLLLKVFAVVPLSAMIHTSLILAISAMFRQGSHAGATYAGIYFFSYFFTFVMEIVWIASNGQAPKLVPTLSYFSVDGVQIGLFKAILHTNGTPPFAMPSRNSLANIAAPPLLPYMAFVFLLTAACMWFIWSRVRAVEVVS